MFTKKIMAAAAVAIASLGLASSAQATITPGVGSALTANNVGAITLGGTFISCSTSTLSGSVTLSRAINLGGQGNITAGSFGSCGFGRSATANFTNGPWVLDAVPTAPGANTSNVTVTNVDVTVVVLGATCRYTGSLAGTGDNAADTVTLSNAGGLSLVSGGSACPTNPNVNGTWKFTTNVTVS